MVKTLTLSLGAVVVAAGILSTPVQANYFTSEAAFDAANPGLPVLNFEGICTSDNLCAVPAFPGVTIGGPNPVIVGTPFLPQLPSPTDYLLDNTLGGFLSFAFSPDVTAVGFNLSAGLSGGNLLVTVFNGATVLDSQTVTTVDLSQFTTFAGFSGLGNITSLRVDTTDAAGNPHSELFVNVDNLAFGTPNGVVPEPASLALLGLGLAGLGFARRRA